MVDINPNKLGEGVQKAAQELKKAPADVAKGFKELKGAAQEELQQLPKVDLARNPAKDGIELGGHESPSPNTKIPMRQPIPKAILDIAEKDPIGAITTDLSTAILPEHNIIDRTPIILQGEPGSGKTQVTSELAKEMKELFGSEPIEGLVTQDVSAMITPAADKAKLLKDVADAEKKYNPKITTFIGDEALPDEVPYKLLPGYCDNFLGDSSKGTEVHQKVLDLFHSRIREAREAQKTGTLNLQAMSESFGEEWVKHIKKYLPKADDALPPPPPEVNNFL